MKAIQVRPTGVERKLGDDELIVTKTDPPGVLTYWVLAHVTPSTDAQGRLVGYHSSRRRPDPGPVAAISKIYAELRAEERRHDNSSAGLDASWARLQGILAARSQTYDEFVWSLTNGAY